MFKPQSPGYFVIAGLPPTKKRVDRVLSSTPREKPLTHRREERIPTISKFSREPARSPGLSTPKGCQLSHLPLVSRGRPRELRPRPAFPTIKCQGPLPTRFSQISFQAQTHAAQPGRAGPPGTPCWGTVARMGGAGPTFLLSEANVLQCDCGACQGTPTSQRSRHDGFDAPTSHRPRPRRSSH